MKTPLTDLQREVLSAYVDGELTDAERATAEALLRREDAAEYVASLRATAALVSTHARVRAPVGLSGRVMGALESEFKPKAFGPGSEPFTSAPILNWRAPLYAAAAAIIVAVAIMFGPALTTPSSPPSVARGPLDDLPQDGTAEDPDANVMLMDERPAPEAQPAEDPAMRRSEAGEWGAEREKLAESETPRKENAKAMRTLDEAEDQNESGAGEAPGAENEERKREPARTKSAKPDTERAERDDDSGGSSGKTGTGGGRVAGGLKKEDSGRDARGAESKDKLGDAKPPMRPGESADAKDEVNKESETGLTIAISDAHTIAAQTDVLWISNLYGSAEVADEESDVESVTVEIDPAKLPELLAALRKLAREQGYGEVEGDEQQQAFAREGREQGQGIKGYLPADEPEKAAPEPPSSDEPKPAAKPAEDVSAEKVRVVIRLK